MVNIGNILMGLNILIAMGTIISGLVSLMRGGFVARAIDSIQKIDRIEEEVNEINSWKDDIEVLIIAMSNSDEDIDEQAVLSRLDRDIGYQEFIDLKSGIDKNENDIGGD